MKNQRKIISVLLALVMALSVFTAAPLSASAGGIDDVPEKPGYPGYVCSGETDDYRYSVYNRIDKFNDNAEYKVSVITEYIGSETNIVIPDTLGGYPVESIESCAFSDCTGLTSVTLPESVGNIGYRAFFGCTGLTSVTLSDSVYYIDIEAFSGCTGLTSIALPDYAYIEPLAFSYCTGLTNIYIPASVTIPYENSKDYDEKVTPFLGCSGLQVVYGYYGTDAEKFAAEFDIPFRMIAPATSDEVTLETPEGYTYSVVKKATNDEASPVENQPLPEGSILLDVYDITLRSAEDETPVQPGAPVTVRIRCDNPNARVFRREADGSLTDMHARYENGYLIFETDHFSIYLVAELAADVDLAVCGDADGDGEVSIIDVTIIQRYLAGITVNVPEAVILRNGDVDGNEKLEIIDATWIQRSLVNMEIPYAVGTKISK